MKTRSSYWKRLMALLLVVAMTMSLAACAGSEKETAKSGNNEISLQVGDEVVAVPEEPDEMTREEKELVAELIGGYTDPGAMSDDELDAVVQQLITNMDKETSSNIVNLADKDKAPNGVTENPDAYDENGAMKEPFDVVYPEYIEQGVVTFSGESILVKLPSGQLTTGLKAAGVGALEEIVPMEDCAWYEAKLIQGTTAEKALSAVRQLKEVMLAEYNYEIQTAALDDYKHFDDKTDKEFQKNGHNKDQWHQHYCGIPDGYEEMETEGGDPSVVVAVIDSGVDYDHEDLIDNMWVNTKEIPDNNCDDDGNGYVDDYYGIDLVAGKGNADDDNGHGTHVAGIIAGRNNNTGIVGIAYNVKIMPIKAAMHNGTLNQANIAKAILYAYEMGAEVINMSFGGSACSIAVQDALATAYNRCVLVASAGNSGYPNQKSDYMDPLPNYPAALTYVLGVMSVDANGVESSFTNWDTKAFNGVEYEVYAPGENIMSTLPDNRYGYLSGTSMAAPIVSSFAAILRSEFNDRSMYPTKFIYGQLSCTSDYHADCVDPQSHTVGGQTHDLPQIVNLEAALTKLPKPEVNYQDYAIFDDPALSEKNNGDGVIDAGETIALGMTLRNRWGMSENTVVTIDTLENGISDPYITIVNPSVDYGRIGTYSTGDCGKIYTDDLHTGWENPFILKISEDCPNDYRFTLNVVIRCENALDEKDDTLYIFGDDPLEPATLDPRDPISVNENVRAGYILPTVIDADMVLTPDNLYIIPNATVIQEGVTVRVEPGTHIQFWSDDANDPYADSYIAYLLVNGNFLVEGTRENPVYIYPSQLMDRYSVEIGSSQKGYVSLKYAEITNLFCDASGNTGTLNHIDMADHCTFRNNYTDVFLCRELNNGLVSSREIYTAYMGDIIAKDCVFYKIGRESYTTELQGSFDRCIFVQCGLVFNGSDYRNSVFLGNAFVSQTKPDKYSPSTMLVEGVVLPEADRFTVYYREETGTTYVHYVAGVYGADVERYAETMRAYISHAYGGDYVVVETQEEYDWLEKYGSNRYVAGFKRGADDTFFWSDGTPVAEQFLPLQIHDPNGSDLYLYDGKLHFGNYDWIMYEIPGQIPPEEITFREYAVDMDLESVYRIAPESTPIQLPAEAFLYESSDKSVLTVSDTGLVTPVGKGTADVWVLSSDRAVKNYITFTVKEYVPLEGLTFAQPAVEVAAGEMCAAGIVFTPYNTTRKNVTYTSSNEAVAVVDMFGNITGIASGTATVTAQCEEVTCTLQVEVYNKTASLDIPHYAFVLGMDELPRLPEVVVSEGADVELSWTSTDEEVLQILEGQPVVHKPGSTTLTVTDAHSGLCDSVDVYVLQKTGNRVVDIQENHALLEDGSLYNWASNRKTPILSGVKNFAYDSTAACLFVAMEDGSLAAYKHGELHPISTEGMEGNVVDVWAYIPYSDRDQYDDYWVVTDTGAVYHVDGIGGTPAKMPFNEPIRSIDGNHYRLAVIAESGNLYYTKSNSTPNLIARNVTYAEMGYYDICYISNNRGYNYDTENDTYYETNMYYDEYEQVYIHPGWYSDTYMTLQHALVAKNGKVSVVNRSDYGYGVYETWDIMTNVDAVALYGFGLYKFGPNNKNCGAYVATADGLLYSISDKVLPIVLGLPEETLKHTATNLTKEGVLEENTLRIQFNKNIANASAKLYENGTQIAAAVTWDKNTLSVSTHLAFVEGVSYSLVISAANTSGYGTGLRPAEDIVISFVYQASTAAPADPEDAPQETVIHTSILDTSISRFLTPEAVAEQMKATAAETGYSPFFSGNAILNPIATDTNVEHWLRIQAPSISAGEYREIPLGGNWWSTTNQQAIELQMMDYTDFITYARLMYAPYLTQAPENTFPFVTSVKLFNGDGEEVTTVGNEKVTFRVTFNRDMDTSIPLQVRFGSAYPYGDYEIEGQYVDARTWEGTYTLNTLIENGNQFFTISNGCSATDDLELQIDQKRFGFVIDTTAAQALIMQGTATDTGIELRWTQDDFDTLMGYNVYRATSKDGLYTRVNKTVIPANTMTFFDDGVEPGVVYYYNFTVVKTDLTESEPSGKISIMSKDTMAPNIYHSPVSGTFTGANLVLSATVTDNLNIAYANLYYRIAGTDSWSIIRMNNLNDKYSAIIPAAYITLAGLEYYIEAFDGVSYTCKGSSENPYTIMVQEAVDVSALGDVDGDGIITNLDALLLLYAINDKYNLTADEFVRADLDGDGKLQAYEALRILQYVSGTVGSVKM